MLYIHPCHLKDNSSKTCASIIDVIKQDVTCSCHFICPTRCCRQIHTADFVISTALLPFLVIIILQQPGVKTFLIQVFRLTAQLLTPEAIKLNSSKVAMCKHGHQASNIGYGQDRES